MALITLHNIEVLGRGGFGAVLKARDRMQGRKVAVKIIQSEKSWKKFVLRKTSAASKEGQKEANLLMNLLLPKHTHTALTTRNTYILPYTVRWLPY